MGDHDHLKLYKKVVVKLTPKFGLNKISSFSSASDLLDYDIADDSCKYQTALDNFRNHFGRFMTFRASFKCLITSTCMTDLSTFVLPPGLTSS